MGSATTNDTGRPDRHSWLITCTVAATWVVLIALDFLRPPIDLERWLFAHFPPRMKDAYDGVNPSTEPPATTVALTWLCLTAGFLLRRRTNELTAILLGPSITTILLLASEDSGDPNWHSIVAVTWIGCLVSLVASVVVSCVRPTR